jgi:hypothetical protein
MLAVDFIYSGARFLPFSACGDRQKSTDSVEKVGHGLRIRKVRVRD